MTSHGLSRSRNGPWSRRCAGTTVSGSRAVQGRPVLGERGSQVQGQRRGGRVFRRRPGAGHTPLTVSGVGQLIRDLGERAGLQKRVYPHLLRHSFATTMLNRGMDPITLSRILGHSSLLMIQRTYTHQTVGDPSEALLRALATD